MYGPVLWDGVVLTLVFFFPRRCTLSYAFCVAGADDSMYFLQCLLALAHFTYCIYMHYSWSHRTWNCQGWRASATCRTTKLCLNVMRGFSFRVICRLRDNFSLFSKTLKYITKKMGSSTEPSGISQVTGGHSEVLPFSTTLCVLPESKSLIDASCFI